MNTKLKDTNKIFPIETFTINFQRSLAKLGGDSGYKETVASSNKCINLL